MRKILDPHWLIGFIDGEGCFYINVQKYNYVSDKQRREKVWLTFQLTQHSRDTLFMESIIKYLNCGKVATRNSSPAVDFLVNSFTDIHTKVIPFLKKYPLQSVNKRIFTTFVKPPI